MASSPLESIWIIRPNLARVHRYISGFFIILPLNWYNFSATRLYIFFLRGVNLCWSGTVWHFVSNETVSVKAGLPDFSWYNLPKREKIFQKVYTKYTKWPQNLANGHTIYQTAVKYTK
jgi:hypothetical protein